MNSTARPFAIWSGESPRAMSERTFAMACSKLNSLAFIPRLAPESGSAARAWARAAEYSHPHFFEQR